MNAAFAKGMTFGKDVVFSYGPLGFVYSPLDIGNNLILSWIFRFSVHVLFGITLIYLSVTKKLPYSLPVFFVCCLMSMYIGLTYEYHLQFVLILCLCISLETDRASLIWSTIAALFASVLIFIRLSLFITSIGTLALFLIIIFIKKHPQRFKSALIMPATLITSTTAIALYLFHSFHNFGLWLYRSFEIADGYNVAMSSTAINKHEFYLAIMVVFIFIFLLLYMWKYNKHLFYPLFLVILCVFMAFKHGFVSSEHALLFFSFMLSVFAIAIVFSKDFSGSIPGIISFFIALLMSSYVVADHQKWNDFDGVNGLSGKTGIFKIRHLSLGPDALRKLIAHISNDNLQDSVLPDSFVKKVNAAGLSVDVVPWETSYIPANNFNWQPNPVFQYYSIYTPHLDNWTAKHYMEPDRPDIILLSYQTISQRYLLWDAPKSWRAIMDHYEACDSIAEKDILVLCKRKIPLSHEMTHLKSTDIRIKRWIDVPSSENLLFVKIDMPLSYYGKFRKMLYKIPPVYIDVIYNNGKQTVFRMIPPLASQGLIINHLPENLNELHMLLNGTPTREVIKIRLHGTGLYYYPPALTLEWYEMKPGNKYTDAPSSTN